MRLRDFQRAEESIVAHCPVRDLCPVGAVCGRGDSEGKIMPAVMEYDKGDLLWTDRRYERHVFIIREGVVSCMAHVEPDGEAPSTALASAWASPISTRPAPTRAPITCALSCLAASARYHPRP